MATKRLSYKGYKYILNKVAYKLVKSKKTYKHSDKYIIGKKEKTYSEIIKTIKSNGKNIKQDEYISRFIEDVYTQNKKDFSFMPGHVYGSGKSNKYSRKSYKNMIKTVLKYRKEHNGQNPKSITVTYKKISQECQNPYTSKPHYTNYGCNALGQCTPYFCGPHSIHQGFRKFGVTNISEYQFASWAGTTSSGTDHDGLNTAIKMGAKKSGFDVDITWYNFSDLGNTNAERFKKYGEMICQPNVFGFFHIGYQCSGECSSGTEVGHYEGIDIVDIEDKEVRALNSLGSRSDNGYYGHLQWRSFALQAHFISNISQKSVCIVTKK